MTQVEQLIASLTATADDNRGIAYDDGQYLDWSSRNSDGTYTLEAGADSDAAQLTLTRDQILALQQRLTAWLLATA